MQYSLKNVLKLASGYSLASIAGPLVSLLMTPIITRVVHPSDYGVIEVITTTVALVASLASLGLYESLSLFYHKKDEWGEYGVLTTAVVGAAVMSGILALICLVFAKPLASFILNDVGYAPLVEIAALSIFCSPLVSLFSLSGRLRMSIKQVNMVGFTMLLVSASLNLLLAVHFKMGARGMIWASTGAGLACLVVGFFFTRPNLRIKTASFKCAKAMIRVGICGLPAILGFTVLNSIDRLILANFVSKADLGLYGIANKLAAIVGTALGLLESAWWPFAMKFSRDSDAPLKFSKAFELFAFAATVIALGVGLLSPEVLRLLTGPAFHPAFAYVPALVAYYGPLIILSNRASIGLYISGRLGIMSLCMGLAAIVNILLNLWWAPLFGVNGAVAATVASGVVWLVALYFAGRPHYHIPYRYCRIGVSLVVFALLITLCSFPTHYYPSFWVRVISVVGYFVLACKLFDIEPHGYLQRWWVKRRLPAL